MMRGELLCWDGRRIRLPDAVEWRFQYGCGTPCDSFQLTCLWEPDSGNDLAEAVSFTAEENGERLFTGVVDECERGWDDRGGHPYRGGRGMAARCWTTRRWGQTTRWPLLRISCGTTWPPTALRPCGGRSCRRCRASRWTRGAASGRWSMNSAAITGELPPGLTGWGGWYWPPGRRGGGWCWGRTRR